MNPDWSSLTKPITTDYFVRHDDVERASGMGEVTTKPAQAGENGEAQRAQGRKAARNHKISDGIAKNGEIRDYIAAKMTIFANNPLQQVNFGVISKSSWRNTHKNNLQYERTAKN